MAEGPPVRTAEEFLAECATQSKKLTKTIIEDGAALLLQASSEWLESFRAQVDAIFASNDISNSALGAHLLYLLSKVLIKAADMRKFWAPTLSQHLGTFLGNIQGVKDIDHVEKIISSWSKYDIYDKELTNGWLLALAKHKDSVKLTLLLKETSPAAPRNEKKRAYSAVYTPTTQGILNRTISSAALLTNSHTPATPAMACARTPSIYGVDGLSETMQSIVGAMGQYIYAIFSHFLTPSSSTLSAKEILNYKIIMSTAFCLFHTIASEVEPSDDFVAMCLACVYLSGKVEYFFLKLDRLRALSVTSKAANDLFGNSGLPTDRMVFDCELELLQMIQFDANRLFNPVKMLMQISTKHALRLSVHNKAMDLLTALSVLQDGHAWQHGCLALVCYHVLLADCIDGNGEDMENRLKKLLHLSSFLTSGMLRSLRELVKHYIIVLAAQDEQDALKAAFHEALLPLIQRILHPMAGDRTISPAQVNDNSTPSASSGQSLGIAEEAVAVITSEEGELKSPVRVEPSKEPDAGRTEIAKELQGWRDSRDRNGYDRHWDHSRGRERERKYSRDRDRMWERDVRDGRPPVSSSGHWERGRDVERDSREQYWSNADPHHAYYAHGNTRQQWDSSSGQQWDRQPLTYSRRESRDRARGRSRDRDWERDRDHRDWDTRNRGRDTNDSRDSRTSRDSRDARTYRGRVWPHGRQSQGHEQPARPAPPRSPPPPLFIPPPDVMQSREVPNADYSASPMDVVVEEKAAAVEGGAGGGGRIKKRSRSRSRDDDSSPLPVASRGRDGNWAKDQPRKRESSSKPNDARRDAPLVAQPDKEPSSQPIVCGPCELPPVDKSDALVDSDLLEGLVVSHDADFRSPPPEDDDIPPPPPTVPPTGNAECTGGSVAMDISLNLCSTSGGVPTSELAQPAAEASEAAEAALPVADTLSQPTARELPVAPTPAAVEEIQHPDISLAPILSVPVPEVEADGAVPRSPRDNDKKAGRKSRAVTVKRGGCEDTSGNSEALQTAAPPAIVQVPSSQAAPPQEPRTVQPVESPLPPRPSVFGRIGGLAAVSDTLPSPVVQTAGRSLQPKKVVDAALMGFFRMQHLRTAADQEGRSIKAAQVEEDAMVKQTVTVSSSSSARPSAAPAIQTPVATAAPSVVVPTPRPVVAPSIALPRAEELEAGEIDDSESPGPPPPPPESPIAMNEMSIEVSTPPAVVVEAKQIRRSPRQQSKGEVQAPTSAESIGGPAKLRKLKK